VNEVRNQVLAFIDHCYAHDHTSYLDSDVFMEDINNKLMTEKLLTKLWTDQKIWKLKEPLTSIKVIAEWLNFVQSGLNYARMRTNKVVTEVNTNSGEVQKSNIATAISESNTSSRVNVSTAQNKRNTLAAITKVPKGQLLEFSDSEDDDELLVCGEGNQDNNDEGDNDPISSEGEGNTLASFTN
jgi:predicted house-cleaning noncanonical NTP pyrophosphatase (MazG superfamily)